MENNTDIKEEVRFPMIGNPAPPFKAVTTHGEVNFPKDYKGKWVILFSHPADFTPVCTTEFMTFASLHDEFLKLNCDLIGLSIDSVHAHLGWAHAIQGYEWNEIKNAEVKFPIIDDVKMDVAKKYGMIQGDSDTKTVRAVFFIDPEGKIRTMLYYPAALGRNFDEIKRILIGLQKADSDQVALPANWTPGKDVILPAPSKSEDIGKRIAEAKDSKDMTQLDWYLTFKQDKGNK